MVLLTPLLLLHLDLDELMMSWSFGLEFTRIHLTA
jgi:hypothetical protein